MLEVNFWDLDFDLFEVWFHFKIKFWNSDIDFLKLRHIFTEFKFISEFKYVSEFKVWQF